MMTNQACTECTEKSVEDAGSSRVCVCVCVCVRAFRCYGDFKRTPVSILIELQKKKKGRVMPLRQTFFLLKALKPPLTSNEKKKNSICRFLRLHGKIREVHNN